MIHQSLLTLPHNHAEEYMLWDPFRQLFCGPCFFRDGFLDELPTRVTIKTGTGNFGAPAIDSRLVEHIELSFGLVPPDPGEPLHVWRRRRDRFSNKPSPGLFPFGSALWNLMNYQPPLARVLVKFCQGKNESQIASELDLSLFNVHDRMVKAVRTGQGFLKHGDKNLV